MIRRRHSSRIGSPLLRDLVDDVISELSTRRSRTVLIIAAVALSTGALLAAFGISTTAMQQVGADIAGSTLNVLTVSAANGGGQTGSGGDSSAGDTAGADNAPEQSVTSVFPSDAEKRAARLPLVIASGRRVDPPQAPQTEILGGAGTTTPQGITLVGAMPGYLTAAQTPLRAGRSDELGSSRQIAILGDAAAKALGVPISNDPTGQEIFIGGISYDVIDFASGGGQADLSESVIIPYKLAVGLAGGDAQAEMLVRVAPGAGSPVAKVIRQAVRPDDPQALNTSQVVSLAGLRKGVNTQLGKLTGGIGLFLLVLTALLIANSMIVSVVARTSEIGLRRALGTSRAGVSAVFWGEGLVVGLVGGVTGSAVASLAVVGVSWANTWTMAMSPWTLPAGPILGGLVGVAASAYPAWRATHISPAVAVRSD